MIALFDIGGTNLRSATYHNGVLSNIEIVSTPNYLQGLSINQINEGIIDIICSYANKYKPVEYIAICFAGPVSKNMQIIGSSVIYGEKPDKPIDLSNEVFVKTGKKVICVVNDLFAASWRYIDTYNKFMLVTISSGIGNKIVINNDVQIGEDGLEGELGHVTAFGCNEVKIECGCGFGFNHIGTISSGRGIEIVANKLKESIFSKDYKSSGLNEKGVITAQEIASAAETDDKFALNVIDYCTKPLAHAFCTILSSLYLEKIILMGGLVQNSKSYIKLLVKNMINFGIYNYTPKMIEDRITLCYNDDEHGLQGLIKYINHILELST